MENQAEIIEEPNEIQAEIAAMEQVDEPAPDDAESEVDEVEVVLSGEPAPEEQMPVKAFHARKARYERKIGGLEESSKQKDQTIAELQAKLSELTPPDPEDSGYDDQKHAAAMARHEAEKAALIAEETQRLQQGMTASQAQTAQAQKAQDDALNAHYDRVTTLKVPDYVEAEDAATEILGTGLVASIMSDVDKSELVLYHLGKNPEKARELQLLGQTNPTKLTLALGALSERLQAKPKTKQPPPPPDEVEGASPAGGVGYWQKQYDKELERLMSSDADPDMSSLTKIRRQAEAAGSPIG